MLQSIKEWAMEPQLLEVILQQAQAVRDGFTPLSAQTTGYQVSDGVATVPIDGILLKSVPRWLAWFGVRATAYSDIGRQVRDAAEDPAVKEIRLAVNSPGGQVAGVDEATEAIQAARHRKPVTAIVDEMAMSAAYWLASQSSQITAGPNDVIGSIGVFIVETDSSARAEKDGLKIHVIRSGELKGGVPGSPISDKHLAATQKIVDGMAANFVSAVSMGRGVDTEKSKSWATGQVWIAKEALAIGLIDKIQNTGVNIMSNENDRKTFAAMKEIFPDDLDFVSEQFEAGATLEGACKAYCERLRDGKIEKYKAKAKNSETDGAPPVGHGGEGGNAGGRNLVAEAKELAKSEDITFTEAMRKIHMETPNARDLMQNPQT